MVTHARRLVVAAVIPLLAAAFDARAQPGGRHLGGDITFSSGQNVQPVFEGWTRNSDGSYELHFGYLNRNYVEQLHVPIGPANAVEPGGPDRGQPTYFYPRFNRRLFSVTVPRDWGKKEVVWTLTLRGKSERAVGWLQPDWEVEPSPGGGDRSLNNAPPTITVTNPSRVNVSSPLTLTASVMDDGLPGPSKPRTVVSSENPPAFRFPQATPTVPVNVPQIQRAPRPRVTGLSVSWLVWRGPAGVAFEPAVGAVKDGQAVVTATFSKPGEYVLRARASDTSATTLHDVKVIVSDQDPQRRP